MYPLKSHDLPIEETMGQTTYIRLRFSLNKYPIAADINEYIKTAQTWLKDCENGKFFDKKMKILSFNVFFKYYTPAVEVDFDIVNEPYQIIDELIDRMITASKGPYTQTEIVKATVGYCNLG